MTVAERIDDKPVSRIVETYADMLACATHPATRLGFLDAQAGKPFDHDDILRRIKQETPAGALKRLGWDVDWIDQPSFALAQCRYEEGRLLVTDKGLRCRAWGHPDFPPKQVLDWLRKEFAQRLAELPPRPSIPIVPGSIVAALRGETPPLLERMCPTTSREG